MDKYLTFKFNLIYLHIVVEIINLGLVENFYRVEEKGTCGALYNYWNLKKT